MPKLWKILASVSVLTIFGAAFSYWSFNATPSLYYIVDTEVWNDCKIFDQNQKAIAHLPLGFCDFYANGDMIGSTQNEIVYIQNGAYKWQRPGYVHHQLSIDPYSGQIVSLCYDRSETKKTIIHHDCIRILSRDGKEIFYWSAKDHYEEFKERLPKASLPYLTDTHWRTKKRQDHYSHINHFQILEKNILERSHPAFHRGNLLVSDWGNKWIFIIGRTSKKIEWGVNLADLGYDAPHTAQMNSKGDIVFFITNIMANPQKKSGIGIYNVTTGTLKNSVAFEVRDFSNRGGSVYVLPNETLLVGSYGGNRSLLVSNDGSNIRPFLDKNLVPTLPTTTPLFSIRAVSKKSVDNYLRTCALQ